METQPTKKTKPLKKFWAEIFYKTKKGNLGSSRDIVEAEDATKAIDILRARVLKRPYVWETEGGNAQEMIS